MPDIQRTKRLGKPLAGRLRCNPVPGMMHHASRHVIVLPARPPINCQRKGRKLILFRRQAERHKIAQPFRYIVRKRRVVQMYDTQAKIAAKKRGSTFYPQGLTLGCECMSTCCGHNTI